MKQLRKNWKLYFIFYYLLNLLITLKIYYNKCFYCSIFCQKCYHSLITFVYNSQYSAHGALRLVLGQKFEPGSDMYHFCQPTSVAIAPDGEIVVADGYCNSRIMLFDLRGNPKYSIDERTFIMSLILNLSRKFNNINIQLI